MRIWFCVWRRLSANLGLIHELTSKMQIPQSSSIAKKRSQYLNSNAMEQGALANLQCQAKETNPLGKRLGLKRTSRALLLGVLMDIYNLRLWSNEKPRIMKNPRSPRLLRSSGIADHYVTVMVLHASILGSGPIRRSPALFGDQIYVEDGLEGPSICTPLDCTISTHMCSTTSFLLSSFRWSADAVTYQTQLGFSRLLPCAKLGILGAILCS